MTVFYFGHHKAATETVRTVLATVGEDLGLCFAHFHSPADFGYDLQGTVEQRALDLVAYTNADPRYVENLRLRRGFHLIRDPRDMVVSAYYSHRNSHSVEGWPELVPHRARLRSLGLEEGLMAEMEFMALLRTDGVPLRPFEAMRAWDYGRPAVKELRFEDFAADPYDALLAATRFVGLARGRRSRLRDHLRWRARSALRERRRRLGLRPGRPGALPRDRLLEIVYEHRFARVSEGRRAGRADEAHHFRKGRPGDWRTHFSPEHVRRFKELFPGLVSQLGYEPDEGWDVAKGEHHRARASDAVRRSPGP